MFGALFSTNDEFQISMRMSSGTDKLQYVNSLLVNMYLSSTEIIRTVHCTVYSMLLSRLLGVSHTRYHISKLASRTYCIVLFP